MTDSHDFIALSACPRCGKAPLDEASSGYRCAGCKTEYPRIDDLPWLFAEPDAALGEWRHRLQLALQQLAHESERIGQDLKKDSLLATTRQRLERLATANDAHRRTLAELLAPFDVQSMTASYESHLALRTRLPSDQGLNTYYGNVHRDWVWGDEENSASVECIAAVTDAHGQALEGDVLILGAGAGRLAWDLHQRRASGRTAVLDFNPLLLSIARHLYAGETLELIEFPLAPASAEDVAIEQTLAAPNETRPGITPILGDVLRPPFGEKQFDAVITPWLIDIVSEDLRQFAPRINRLLKDDGRWITFGSLAFDHASRARRYSPDEVGEIATESGFTTPQVAEARIPYMNSPHSRHGRQELVYTASMQKHRKAKAPGTYKALPDWIVTGKEPVPLIRAFQTQAMSTRIYAFIMSLIDGRRSIDDMATLLEQQKLMPKSEAKSAIRNFLIRMHEDAQRNPNF